MQKDEKIFFMLFKIHKYFNNNLKHLFIESEKKQMINIVNPRLYYRMYIIVLCISFMFN